jgi:AcrR family transcriptional regulator
MEQKLSKEKIIQTAFDILAEKRSIEGLSMRNLAHALNVKAPAIYWYFKDKQDLLQNMAETMEQHLRLPDSSLEATEQLIAFMNAYYDLYTQFPCGAELETMNQLLLQQGYSFAQSRHAVISLHYLLIGYLIDQQKEEQLTQKIIDGNHYLLQSVQWMRHYAQEQSLESFNFALSQREQIIDVKEIFMSSVKIYLLGLEQLKK